MKKDNVFVLVSKEALWLGIVGVFCAGMSVGAFLMMLGLILTEPK